MAAESMPMSVRPPFNYRPVDRIALIERRLRRRRCLESDGAAADHAGAGVAAGTIA